MKRIQKICIPIFESQGPIESHLSGNTSYVPFVDSMCEAQMAQHASEAFREAEQTEILTVYCVAV